MFTGIIREVGSVRSLEEVDGGRRLTVLAPALAGDVEEGDSVAVDGTCLTVTGAGGDAFTVEVVGTTLSRTVAGVYETGTPVNLEPALTLADGLDGHLVQGHVDGVGELVERRRVGNHRLLTVEIPAEVWELTILHGSVALNGVSLTVNALTSGNRIEVAIIPHTWSHTNLDRLEPGDPVNVEGDLLGKYVGRIVEQRGWPDGPDAASGRDSQSPGESTP